jgi:hypothetical protein
MYGIDFLGLAALAAFAVAPGAPRATPQINIYIGAAPIAPMVTMTTPLTTAFPTATTVRNGFVAASSLAQARGFMGPTTFKAWSITHSIHNTAITAHCPRLATSLRRSGEPQSYSTEMKCAMGAATSAERFPASNRMVNVRPVFQSRQRLLVRPSIGGLLK